MVEFKKEHSVRPAILSRPPPANHIEAGYLVFQIFRASGLPPLDKGSCVAALRMSVSKILLKPTRAEYDIGGGARGSHLDWIHGAMDSLGLQLASKQRQISIVMETVGPRRHWRSCMGIMV